MWLTYTALQANWEVRLSTSRGVPYFYNTDTHESIWEAPPGLTQEQIAALPGARQHLLEGGRPAQVRASHLLVKHRGSRRPSSWKEVSGPLPPYVLTHSTSCVLQGKHHSLKGGGYRNLERVRCGDQRLSRQVRRTRVQAQRLQFALEWGRPRFLQARESYATMSTLSR